MDTETARNFPPPPLSRKDKHFYSIRRRFQNSTPKTYRKISLEASRLVYGPELPDKAFLSLDALQCWYRAVLYAWLGDSLSVIDLWQDRIPSLENKLALSQLVLEARNNGVRRIQRRLLRDSDGVPRELPISSYSELSTWCDFMFRLLNDEDEHVSHERDTLTMRYDKGVAYRVEEERKEREAKQDKWVAAMTHSFMKALCKGEPKTIEPDDDWLLVVWGGLAGKQSVREATVSLFIDATEQPKKPHTALLDDIISATWKAMRELGSVCYAEPSAATSKQVRKHLDAVKRFCSRQDRDRSADLIPQKFTEPALSNTAFEKIQKIIQDTFVAAEQHPRAYRGKGEEDLRDHVLTVLRTHYPNSTGETFNKKGKTDILIRHNGSNIFVGECKFWKGLKAFHETIDQILGYLTWRDSKAAIVCFVDKKELMPVLDQISSGTPEHPCFIRLESTKAESWLRFEFRLKSDPTRNVHLAVLCFHFPPN